MAIDKELGAQLRLQGFTQQQVADKLGCSLIWVKTNLKGIKKVNNDTTLIELVRSAGRSVNGTTTGEIKALVLAHYPMLQGDNNKRKLNDKVAQIKRQAKKGHKDVIIRPYWLQPDCAQDSINTIMDMSQHVYELIHELATKYRKLYDLDASHQKSIAYHISMLSSGDGSPMLPQGFQVYGDYLASLAETLNERNQE